MKSFPLGQIATFGHLLQSGPN